MVKLSCFLEHMINLCYSEHQAIGKTNFIFNDNRNRLQPEKHKKLTRMTKHITTKNSWGVGGGGGLRKRGGGEDESYGEN